MFFNKAYYVISPLIVMKRISCPKCGHYLTFDEKAYPPDRVLVFVCPACQKQFKIKLGAKAAKDKPLYGKLIVLENAFHERQELPLRMGENIVGRYVKNTSANRPIMTDDPSIDTTHCIVTVRQNKQGDLQFVLRDAPSLTGTFYQGNILRDQDRILIEDEAVINIGGTTLIVQLHPSAQNTQD